MTHNVTDASDASVQEIAVNDRNPIVTVQEAATAHRANDDPSTAAYLQSSGADTGSLTAPLSDQQNDWEIVDEGNTPFAKGGFGHRVTVGGAKPTVGIIVKLPLDRLLPHPQNKTLFGATSPKEIKDLAESIAETGQQSPIIVTADLEKIGYYTIISGHKRAEALRSMGRNEANCQVEDVKDGDERLLRLLEANRHHIPTTEQKIRIGGLYLGFEAKKAKARQVAGAKAKNGVDVVEVLTQPPSQPGKTEGEARGKARDLAAAKVSMSGISFDKGRKVVQAIDKAAADGNAETAAELRHLLNEKGVDPAHARAVVLDLIEKARKPGASGGKDKGATVMPKSVGNPQNDATAMVQPKPDQMVPLLPGPAFGADTVTTGVATAADTPVVSGPSGPTAAAEDDGQPAVIHIIASCDTLGDELDALDMGDLTADQKGNLYRVLDRVANWLAFHDEVLQVPARK